jgi:transcriptional regulator with XRE-family HTH domain
MSQTTVDVVGLHAALDAARQGRGWSWRQLARELGLSASTMSRLANGQKPDVDAFAAMVAWLQTDANKFIITEERRRERYEQEEPDLVALLAPLLRARRDLDDKDIDHLQELIRSAVRHFEADRSRER